MQLIVAENYLRINDSLEYQAILSEKDLGNFRVTVRKKLKWFERKCNECLLKIVQIELHVYEIEVTW